MPSIHSASITAKVLNLILLPSLAVSQFAANGAQNGVKLMNAHVEFEKKLIVRLAIKEKSLIERAEHIRNARETFEEKQALVGRGSLLFDDGTVIEANVGSGEQVIDPRTPTGFGNPFFRQINVEQNIELNSLLSPHESKEIREYNDGSLQSDIVSGWKQIVGYGSHQSAKSYRGYFMALLAVAPHKIIRRQCDSCNTSHRDIYYRRTDQTGVGGMRRKLLKMMIGEDYGFHSSDCGTGDTECKISNVCDEDFTLHSTYQDAINNANPWQACRTIDFGQGNDMYTSTNKMGFPGYSGISEPTYNQFNMGRKSGQRDYAFSVENTMWIPIFGSRVLQIIGEGAEEENLAGAPKLLLESKNMIIRRVCLDCTDPRYQDIYYRRILPVPKDVDIWNIIRTNFEDQKGNINGYDYHLYSNYNDAINVENEWYCGYESGNESGEAPPPENVIYEAENYIDASSSAEVLTQDKGYTGEGYVKLLESDSYVEWNNLDGGFSGACSLKFRYSNGGLQPQRPAEVTLNGILVADLVLFTRTGDWTTYTYEEFDTVCESGSQTLRLTFAAYSPNIDSIQVLPRTETPYDPTEPEEGTTIKCINDSSGTGNPDDRFRYTMGQIRKYPSAEIAASWDPGWTYGTPFDCTGVPHGEDMEMKPDELPTTLTECRILCCFPPTEDGKGGWANEYMRDICNENNCHYEVDNEGNAFCTGEGSYHDCETENCAFDLHQIDRKCTKENGRLFKTPNGISITLTECYERCYNTVECHYFAFQSGICMGCTIDSVLPRDIGWNAYEMVIKKPLNYFDLLRIDAKCPIEDGRLFKTDTPVTLTECYELCYNTDDCHYFAYKIDTCMGCTIDSEVTRHSGWYAYEMVTKKPHNDGARKLGEIKTFEDQELKNRSYVERSLNDLGQEIGFPGRCRPSINDPLNTYEGQWATLEGDQSDGVRHFAFYIEGEQVAETGLWMTEDDEMNAFLNPGSVLEKNDKISCDSPVVSIDTNNHDSGSFSTDFKPYVLKGRTDNYAGWYDLQNCGNCNDWCGWFSADDVFDGGMNPRYQSWTPGNDVFACISESQFYKSVRTSAQDPTPFFASFIPYQLNAPGNNFASFLEFFPTINKCDGPNEIPPPKPRYEYLGCYWDSGTRALPHRVSNGNINHCYQSCKALGYQFFGRQYYDECWCGGPSHPSYLSYDRYGPSANNVGSTETSQTGIEHNVLDSDITSKGWQKCYSGSYSNNEQMRLSEIMQQCQGTNIMYGCKAKDSDRWKLIGYGNRDKAFDGSPQSECLADEINHVTYGCLPRVVRNGKEMVFFANKQVKTRNQHEESANLCGGNLASYISDNEQLKAINLIGDRSWSGLYQPHTCTDEPSGCWIWSDGTPFEFQDWDSGEPNDFGAQGEDCAELRGNGRYNDAGCSFRLGGVYILPLNFASLPECAYYAKTTTYGTVDGALRWYFSESNGGMGFAKANDEIDISPCDRNDLFSNDRLCWHISHDKMENGWRCGDTAWLNFDDNWERAIWTTSTTASSLTYSRPRCVDCEGRHIGAWLNCVFEILDNVPSDSPYILMDRGEGASCPSGTEPVPQNECVEAASIAAGHLNPPNWLNVASWQHVPCGCFLYYNYNQVSLLDYNLETVECSSHPDSQLICKDPNSAPNSAPSQQNDDYNLVNPTDMEPDQCYMIKSFGVPNHSDDFPPNLMPYKYQIPAGEDPYAGYYDVQRCGKCNDYCFWVGPKKDGSGINPQWKAYTETDYFTCKMAGGYSAPYEMTEKGYFGKSFRFQKCGGEGATTPAYRRIEYLGCFHDNTERALPVQIGTGILSIQDCGDACRAKGYHYFGRQNHGHCFCGGESASDTSYAKYGEIAPLSPAFTCAPCDGSTIGHLKQCVFQILDQYDPEVERKKHECSHIPAIDVRRYCYVSCRDSQNNYKNLLACKTLKITGLQYLNNEIAEWRDSPVCDTKNCIKNVHPLGMDVNQSKGTR